MGRVVAGRLAVALLFLSSVAVPLVIAHATTPRTLVTTSGKATS